MGQTSNDECNQARLEPSFHKGLNRVLSGLNAAMTRNVISATIAHLIPSNGESRIVFSHDFSDLIVGQIEATLEGQDINVRIRTNNLPDGQFESWLDSIADDYIHCPVNDEFEVMSFYEMNRCYKKAFKTLQRESKDKYIFSDAHPGHEFSHLTKSKHRTIPRSILPKGNMYPFKDLDLNHPKPTEQSLDKCEVYAKMALLVFYPF
jgi:hypothetical protein